jgi:predicted O-linked N-acetylglucosamine transferase (SPINDLY family)
LKPDYAEAYNNISGFYLNEKNFEKAKIYIDKCFTCKKLFPKIYITKGNYYKKLNLISEAIETYNEAILLIPNNFDFYIERAELYALSKEYDQAIIDLKEANKIAISKTKKDRCMTLLIKNNILTCNWENYKSQTSYALNNILNKKCTINLEPLTLHNLTDSPKIIMSRIEKINVKPFKYNFQKIKKKKKIHVAYYSSDFYVHPVGLIMLRLLKLHNKNNFEIFCFLSGNSKYDSITNQISDLGNFYDVSKLSNEEIILKSRQLNIDIAVDLNGFTGSNLINSFWRRLAPIQINYLGYPGTVGEHMDYIIADKNIIPKENQEFFFEKIIYLPNYYLANANDVICENNQKKYKKTDFELPETSFVFACFNSHQKINPSIFKSWMRILKKTPKSVLWLLPAYPGVVKNLKNQAEKIGVDPSRIIFAKLLDYKERQARYLFVDLFLDTFPYNAHTTANECLSSGTPLITIYGEGFHSRVAGSLLKNLHFNELIFKTIREYENYAIELAKNPTKLNKLKEKIKTEIKQTTIFDNEIYINNLEKAYINVYSLNEKNKKSENIYLDNY